MMRSRDYWRLRIGRDSAAIALFAVFPVLQVVVTRGATVAVAFAALVLLVMHATTGFRHVDGGAYRDLLRQPAVAVLLVLVGWAFISFIWSPDAGDVPVNSLVIAAVPFIAAWIAGQVSRTIILPLAVFVAAGCLIAGIIMVLDVAGHTQLHRLFDGSAQLYDLNRNALWFALFVPVLALAAWQARALLRWLCILALAASICAVMMGYGQAAQLALLTGFAASLIALVTRFGARIVAVVSILLILVMPYGVGLVDGPVARSLERGMPQANGAHRIAIWSGYEALIAQKPLIGWGGGAARFEGMQGQAAAIAAKRGFPATTTNPHNAALEVWMELGLVGIALVCALLWLLADRIDRMPRATRVAATHLLAGAVAFSLVSSSVYQSWWIATLAAAIIALRAIAASWPARPDAAALRECLPVLCAAAGDEILKIRDGGFAVDEKRDASPVTLADTRAEAVVTAGLRKAFPHIPIIAEEAMAAGERPDISGGTFFLVDPLDGTREFVDGFDDFTVNIAMIRDGVPVAGCIFAPARGQCWYGDTLAEPLLLTGTVDALQPVTRLQHDGPPRVTVSRAHSNAATEAWLDRLGPCERVTVGSSVKFCHLATGLAEIYPRLSPTMEWDSAAGDAILRAAGGCVLGADGAPLIYGDRQPATPRAFENPNFLALAPGVAVPFAQGPMLGQAASSTAMRRSANS